jgi:hypothetical protein
MAAFIRLTSPIYVRAFIPGVNDCINNCFGSAPTPVTAEAFAITPATSIGSASVQINGSAIASMTAALPNGGRSVSFNLGGSALEIPGAINTVSVTANDNNGAATTATFNYFRCGAGGTGTTGMPTTTTTSMFTTGMFFMSQPSSHAKKTAKPKPATKTSKPAKPSKPKGKKKGK